MLSEIFSQLLFMYIFSFSFITTYHFFNPTSLVALRMDMSFSPPLFFSRTEIFELNFELSATMRFKFVDGWIAKSSPPPPAPTVSEGITTVVNASDQQRNYKLINFWGWLCDQQSTSLILPLCRTTEKVFLRNYSTIRSKKDKRKKITLSTSTTSKQLDLIQ